MDEKCKKCGSVQIEGLQRLDHLMLYCKKCGNWWRSTQASGTPDDIMSKMPVLDSATIEILKNADLTPND